MRERSGQPLPVQHRTLFLSDLHLGAVGARADLVLFDPDAPVIVDADALMSRSKNSSFDGRRLQGRVLLTVAAGRIVWREAAGH